MDFKNVKKISIDAGEVKQIAINGVVVWSGYTNQVPISINTDGSIFNGIGYMDGYRLSSSGEIKEQANSAVCGYIPAKTGDIVRLAGLEWSDKGGTLYDYIITYSKNFNKNTTYNSQGYGTGVSVNTEENGITVFTITAANTAYIRINATGSGANMIVTVNEEII